MEYSIKELADLTGVTTRTLRYYDEIGLLNPKRVNSTGYRIYGESEIDLLQQILLYKSMDMKLEDIRKIIFQPDFDIYEALINHHQQLISRRDQLDQLISTVEKTIAYQNGEIGMSNTEKFTGFKKEKISENERVHGREIRTKYGEAAIDASNKRFMDLSESDFNDMQETENKMLESLKEVIETKNLDSKAAENVFIKHKAWLNYTWTSYSAKAHLGLADMYVVDERFAKYYSDRAGADAATTLRDVIKRYAQEEIPNEF